MNIMNLPGFTAEASLSRTERLYCFSGTQHQTSSAVVYPAWCFDSSFFSLCGGFQSRAGRRACYNFVLAHSC